MFYIFSYLRKKKELELKDFRLLVLTYLHVFRCSEDDLTIFRKCLPVCSLQNFVDTVSEELMGRN